MVTAVFKLIACDDRQLHLHPLQRQRLVVASWSLACGTPMRIIGSQFCAYVARRPFPHVNYSAPTSKKDEADTSAAFLFQPRSCQQDQEPQSGRTLFLGP